jgi:Cu(I)/Ag(I) efflux system membrane fusion protein
MEKKGLISRFIVRTATFATILVGGFLAGYVVKGITATHDHVPATAEPNQAEEIAKGETWWTCSMHPQIRQPKPGKCPICFMDLIQESSDGSDLGPRQISFTKEAVKLMEVQ